MNDILSIDYKDWFINQKRIPDKESEEYNKFFEFHKEICLNGCMMNGVFINPFLYWHLNIWHTEVDYIDERGKINQKYANPLLRDNEWIVTNEIERAHNERKGLVILGFPCNQFANQNPGSDDQTQEFCSLNYGVTFPIMKKINVNGNDADPLYKWLKSKKGGILWSAIKWNFTKFLINKNGEVVHRFAPTAAPSSLEKYIVGEL